jgi:hypothetical protein
LKLVFCFNLPELSPTVWDLCVVFVGAKVKSTESEFIVARVFHQADHLENRSKVEITAAEIAWRWFRQFVRFSEVHLNEVAGQAVLERLQ